MPKRAKLPKIIRRRSKLHGFGVFAAEPITKNTRIIDYAGELFGTAERGARGALPGRRVHLGLRVNRAWSRDAAVGGNIARFINHACKPNCWFEVVDTTIWIRASRSIAAGEELTYDYRTEGDQTIRCRCRPGCKTLLKIREIASGERRSARPASRE